MGFNGTSLQFHMFVLSVVRILVMCGEHTQIYDFEMKKNFLKTMIRKLNFGFFEGLGWMPINDAYFLKVHITGKEE